MKKLILILMLGLFCLPVFSMPKEEIKGYINEYVTIIQCNTITPGTVTGTIIAIVESYNGTYAMIRTYNQTVGGYVIFSMDIEHICAILKKG